MNYKQTNWSVISTTEATFKSYSDNGETLSVFIYEQYSPIECTSGHRDKCLKALSVVKNLHDGDRIKYYTKGDVEGWKEKYFYRLELLNLDSKPPSPKDQFIVDAVINHEINGKGVIKEVINRGSLIQLRVLFYSSNREMLVVLNTSTMSIINSDDV